MTENAWLIEKADNEHPGCVVHGEALGVYDGEAPFLNRKRALWGPSDRTVMCATARQRCEAFVTVMEGGREEMTRGEKNKERHKRQVANKPRTERCPYCGRQRPWCSLCETFTSTCCVPYGTCMCS